MSKPHITVSAREKRPDIQSLVETLNKGDLVCGSCQRAGKHAMAVALRWYDGCDIKPMSKCQRCWDHFRRSYSESGYDGLFDAHGYDGKRFFIWMRKAWN